MKKRIYETPHTQHVEVELEGSFCASVVNEDKQETETITIQNHEVGAESDYFTNESEWDF